MNVNMRTVGDVRIVDLSGKITLGEETVTLRTTVRNLVNDGNKKIVLNLADVNYIDSSGWANWSVPTLQSRTRGDG
jgi:anti-sigma B factor antagonist